MSHHASQIADDLFRREGARLVAALVAHLGTHRLQLAEDAVQDALLKALQNWPYRGIPDNPAAWLMQAAKNSALDVLRREQRWNQNEGSIAAESERWLASATSEPANELLPDDTLRMLFVCFHPQLSHEAQMALALRTACGLSPAEIASAYLTSEAAISKRLVRARQRIRELALPFAVPESNDLPTRLEGVLTALYLLFNEGYKSSSGERLIREDLCLEAIRLTQLLSEHPITARPSVNALLALMCLNAARLSARTGEHGEIVLLHQQDRRRWDPDLIQRGIIALGAATAGDRVSPYHLEAGIAACHCLAADDASTDWPRILNLYDQLWLLKPSPIVAMNRSVAVERVSGPRAGLEALENIPNRKLVETQHLYHAIRASFIAKLGQPDKARTAYQIALNLANCEIERHFLRAEMERQCTDRNT